MRVAEVISQDLVQAVGPQTKSVVLHTAREAADLPMKAVVVQLALAADLTSKVDNQGPPTC